MNIELERAVSWKQGPRQTTEAHSSRLLVCNEVKMSVRKSVKREPETMLCSLDYSL
jgi:hypothetical protein